jgi:hypothetical protein
MQIQQEVHVVREVLEGALPSELATAMIFRALRDVDELPQDRESVLALCRGPLASALTAKVGPDVTEEVLARIEQVLVRGDRTGTEVPLEIDVDFEDDVDSTLMMPIAFSAPVSVLVVSSKFRFAERLVASLGDERVYVTSAMDERELRKSVFTVQPLLVVVDGTAAPAMGDELLAQCMRDLPDNALGVVWGDDTPYGRSVLAMLQSTGTNSVGIDEGEGIGPILDLVLARYGGS